MTDNVACNGDIMNFYTLGDVAPAGRFRFRYTSSAGGAEPVTAEPVTDPSTDKTDTQRPEETSEEPREENNNSDTVIIIAACSAAAVAVIAAVIVVIKRRKK